MFTEFLKIAEQLNQIGITPLLMGSLGLELRTGQSWNPQDIDIHVPSDPRGWQASDEERIYRFDELNHIMEILGYHLVDRHEHEFQKAGLFVEFGGIDSLPYFAGVALEDLEVEVRDGISFYLPTLEQYLKIYQASSKDSYRVNKNNQKDFEKIDFLQTVLEH